MTPTEQVSIDSVDLSTAAFWLGQLAHWLDDPDHASQFSWDLFGIPDDNRPPLTLVIRHANAPLAAALHPGPNQTVTPGPNELDRKNLATEITEQLAYTAEWGARLVFPLPHLTIKEAGA